MVDEIVADATEEWRWAVGYEGHYQVSNLGRVRRLPVFRHPHIEYLKGQITPKGYVKFRLSKDGIKSSIFGHKIVMSAFLGPCPEGHQRNHRNRNKKDNRVENLEY